MWKTAHKSFFLPICHLKLSLTSTAVDAHELSRTENQNVNILEQRHVHRLTKFSDRRSTVAPNGDDRTS